MTYKHEQTGETPDIAAPGALWNSWGDWGKLKIWYRTAADWRKAGELMQCAFVEGHWLVLRKYADGTASTTRLVGIGTREMPHCGIYKLVQTACEDRQHRNEVLSGVLCFCGGCACCWIAA